MTQEEKAKAYDKALERVRKQRDDYQKELDKTDKNSQLAGLLRTGISAIELAFPELAESEDERIRKHIVKFIDEQYPTHGNLKDEKDKMFAYLEKQKEQKAVAKLCSNEWSEEDERMRNQLIYDVEHHKKEGLISAKQNKATKALYNGIEKCYDEKIAWLKSLRPSWKPSEEQISALNYFIKLWGNSDDQLEYTKIFNTVKSLRDNLKELI